MYVAVNYSGSGSYGYWNNWNSPFRFVETIIKDTILHGQRYAVVLSTFDNSQRYERSDDSTVYIWKNGDSILHKWNIEGGQQITWYGWSQFPIVTFSPYGAFPENRSENVVFKSTDSLYFENRSVFNLPSQNKTFNAAYKRGTGLVRVSEKLDHASIRLNYTKDVTLIGSIINDQVRGEFALWGLTPIFLGVPKLEATNGDIIRVPILATGMKTRYLIDSTPLQASLSYNASMLEPIAGTQAGSVQNGIRTVPFTFALTPGADTARATLLFRAAVGNDTITTLIPRIEPQSGINYRTTAVNGSVRVFGNQAGGEQQRFFSKAARVRLVAVSPNPASDQLTISLVASEKTPMTISIVNVLGERLLRNEIMLESGIHDVPMSVSGLPRGVYLLTLQTETDIITRQIHILP